MKLIKDGEVCHQNMTASRSDAPYPNRLYLIDKPVMSLASTERRENYTDGGIKSTEELNDHTQFIQPTSETITKESGSQEKLSHEQTSHKTDKAEEQVTDTYKTDVKNFGDSENLNCSLVTPNNINNNDSVRNHSSLEKLSNGTTYESTNSGSGSEVLSSNPITSLKESDDKTPYQTGEKELKTEQPKSQSEKWTSEGTNYPSPKKAYIRDSILERINSEIPPQYQKPSETSLEKVPKKENTNFDFLEKLSQQVEKINHNYPPQQELLNPKRTLFAGYPGNPVKEERNHLSGEKEFCPSPPYPQGSPRRRESIQEQHYAYQKQLREQSPNHFDPRLDYESSQEAAIRAERLSRSYSRSSEESLSPGRPLQGVHYSIRTFPIRGSFEGGVPSPDLLGPHLPNPYIGRDNQPLSQSPSTTVHGKEYFFCHLCSYVGNSKELFNSHMNSHFEHRCPQCDYTSRTEGRLKRHIKDFHSEKPPESYAGTTVMMRSTPGRPKVYKCKQCEYQTVEKIDFWEHARAHIKEDKILQCPKCPFVTEYKHHLEYHLRNHFGSKPFKCTKCNYSCVNKSMLNSHMKSHTNVYQYRCADCTYATKYCHSLKLHLKKYNHKAATVLSTDGSLPTDGSGDFELVSKRGPPRGPRGARRDQKSPPPGQHIPGMLLPTTLSPGQHLNGNMAAVAMQGFWPFMGGQLPNGMYPPPPLIPVSGISPFQVPQGDHKIAEADQNGTKSHENSPGSIENGKEGREKLKCNVCDYSSDSRENLMQHLIKVHAAENQDLFRMFGLRPDNLMEEQARMAAASVLHSMHKSGDQKAIKHEDTSPSGTPNGHHWSSPRPGSESLNGSFGSPMTQAELARAQMNEVATLNERYNNTNAKDLAVKSDKEEKRKPANGERPLDLTGGKLEDEMDEGNHSEEYYERELAERPNLQKRKLDDEASLSPMQNQGSPSSGSVSPTPRKRSRKGKAYKLDTICLKLQERYSPHEEGYNSNEEYGSDYASDKDSGNPEGHENSRPTGYTSVDEPQSADEGSEKQSEDQKRDQPEPVNFTEIHKSLQALNNDKEGEKQVLHAPIPTTPAVTALPEGVDGEEAVQRMLALSTGQSRRRMSMVNPNEESPRQQYPGNRITNGDSSFEKDPKLDSPVSHHDIHSTTPNKNGKTVSNYECQYCDIAFKDVVMYTMHMGYHGYQEPFKCNMCGLATDNRVEFFLHIARVAHE